MDCTEFKEMVGLLVLDALPAEVRTECERHLVEHPQHEGCLEALAEAKAGLERVGDDLEPVAPGEAVWTAIERRIGVVSTPRPRRVLAYSGWLVAAAAAAVLLWTLRDRTLARERVVDLERELAARSEANTAATAVSARALDDCKRRLDQLGGESGLRAEAVSLLQLPGTQLFPLRGEATLEANAILHTGKKRAYLVAAGLVPVADHDYEMWIVQGKRVIAAGLIYGDAGGNAIGRIDYASLLESGAPEKVIVTFEPKGGGPVARGPAVLSGGPKT